MADLDAVSDCYAYLKGFRGGYDARLAAEKSGHEFCAAAVPPEQLVRVVVKALEESPQYLHGNSTSLMLGTMLLSVPASLS